MLRQRVVAYLAIVVVCLFFASLAHAQPLQTRGTRLLTLIWMIEADDGLRQRKSRQ